MFASQKIDSRRPTTDCNAQFFCQHIMRCNLTKTPPVSRLARPFQIMDISDLSDVTLRILLSDSPLLPSSSPLFLKQKQNMGQCGMYVAFPLEASINKQRHQSIRTLIILLLVMRIYYSLFNANSINLWHKIISFSSAIDGKQIVKEMAFCYTSKIVVIFNLI